MIFDDEDNLSQCGLSIRTLGQIERSIRLFFINEIVDRIVGDDTVCIGNKSIGLRKFIDIDNLDEKIACDLNECIDENDRIFVSILLARSSPSCQRENPSKFIQSFKRGFLPSSVWFHCRLLARKSVRILPARSRVIEPSVGRHLRS